jgi:tRNA (adenine22-N1)-methyltransferase
VLSDPNPDRPRTGGPGSGPKLPPRLRAIARLVPEGACVVDVGAGHGLLCVWLLAHGRARGCVATERDRRSGARLTALGDLPGLAVRFGDGLRALEREDRPDVLVMAGLGARTMLRVLEGAGDRLSGLGRLVLQPQTEIGQLRRWLVHRGLALEAERITLERGRFYVTVAAGTRPAARPLSHPALSFDDLMEAGPLLVRSGDPLVRAYWERTATRLDRVLERAPAGRRGGRAGRQRALASRVLAVLEPS